MQPLAAASSRPLYGAAAGPVLPVKSPRWSGGAGRVPAGNVSSPPAGSIAVGGTAGEQLLELEFTMGHAQHKCIALVGGGASRCFLLVTVAKAARLVLDTSQHL